MDVSVFPEIFALLVSIFLFQPLVARAGRHANTWLAGWILLLLHYMAHAFRPTHGITGVVFGLIGMACLPLAEVCYLRAAGNVHKNRVSWLFAAGIAFPMLIQVCALILLPGNAVFQRIAAISFLLPIPLLLRMRQRPRALVGVTAAFAFISVVVMTLPRVNPHLVLDALQMSLFLSVASIYLAYIPRITRASIVAVAGLVAWGITFPLAVLLHAIDPNLHLNHALVVIPQFLFVVGIVFSFIEEVVVRAEHQAQHDPLTGLPNARLFEERATAALSQAIATGTPLAFLVIDVDEFKQINDTLGHSAGDELLRALAVRLSWHIGAGDMLARTGGDEFTAVLAGVADEHHLGFIARAMMSAASVPFVITGKSVDCHISIGIAVAPRIAGDIVSLREAADRAMYHAKRSGGGLLAFATEGKSLEIAG